MRERTINKREIVHVICFIMIVVFILIIFYFSNQPAPQSYQLTGAVVTAVTREPVTQADWDLRGEIINGVRKMAHAIEYFGLGLFFVAFLETSLELKKKKSIYRIAIYYIGVALVAGVDEFHQFFVSGRGASITDIFIDIIGATIGLGTTVIVLWMIIAKRGE